jgi:hypothetical protein
LDGEKEGIRWESIVYRQTTRKKNKLVDGVGLWVLKSGISMSLMAEVFVEGICSLAPRAISCGVTITHLITAKSVVKSELLRSRKDKEAKS